MFLPHFERVRPLFKQSLGRTTMQCPSCQFENMPGSQSCARCRANLAISKMTIDVNPPRASKTSKAIPSELTSIWYRLRFAIDRNWTLLRSGNRHSLLGMRIGIPWPRFGLANRSSGQGIITGSGDWFSLAVPGLVHLRHEERARGWVFLGVYVALIAVLIGFAGQAFSGAAQGFMFAWHLLATMDAMQVRFESFGERIASTLFVGFALGCLFYLPATWAINRVALPISINQAMGTFQAGDVLLVNQVSSPELGEYVLYEITRQQLVTRVPNGNGNIIDQLQGQRVGRVVAAEGQTVAFENEKLSVDGIESAWQPTIGIAFAPTVIPAGHYFVLPETIGNVPNQLSAEFYLGIVVVPEQAIQGTVYYRTHPFSRMTSL